MIPYMYAIYRELSHSVNPCNPSQLLKTPFFFQAIPPLAFLSCVGSHSCCVFMIMLTMSHPKDRISYDSSVSSNQSFCPFLHGVLFRAFLNVLFNLQTSENYFNIDIHL